MKRFCTTLLLLCIISNALAQAIYSKAIVYANNHQLRILSEAGVPTDHGKFKYDTYFISDFSQNELDIISQNGIKYDVLVEDVQAYYKMNLTNDPAAHSVFMMGDPHLSHLRGAGCSGGGSGSGIIDYPQPANFSLGSMGGYLTYDEFIENIDSMAAKYPNLISAKEPIGSGTPFTTADGYPIYWLRISDNPNTDETTEPEVLYTSIHHAREPASLSETIYYMWYLLENYGTDAEVTYIVDNMELYFVPMINPDGYIYNETTDPNGGGMWRKNRRPNGGNSYGVDLNRNYSYQWGVSGASTNPNNDTYMGPTSFSEPETQAIKWLCEQHDFRIAQNAHSYGDLLLHPFGYDNIQTADHTIYTEWTNHMVAQNGFSNILSADLYPAAGDSDDWMYAGDLGTKPKVMAMTPEVGPDAHGFWPPTNQIIPICKSVVFQNLQATHLSWIFGLVEDAAPAVLTSQTGYLQFNFQRLGLEPGNMTIDINPVGFGMASAGTGVSVNLASVLDTKIDSISYTLDAGLLSGQTFQYELVLSNGQYTWRDTITKTYGQGTLVFADDANNLNNWTSSSWATTTADYYSPSSSITDSPGGNYSDGTTTEIELDQTIDLTNALSANMTFWTKFEIEDNWDYCQVMVSNNNGSSWTPMCGLYTQTGTNNQDAGEPVYDGFQSSWVKENIDLNDFLGDQIQIKFRLVSDNFVNEDGFYFDDVEINVIEDQPDAISEFELEVGQAMPNPATDYTFIPFNSNEQSAELEVINLMGQVVFRTELSGNTKKYRLNTSSFSPGVYVYRIYTGDKTSAGNRLTIVK